MDIVYLLFMGSIDRHGFYTKGEVHSVHRTHASAENYINQHWPHLTKDHVDAKSIGHRCQYVNPKSLTTVYWAGIVGTNLMENKGGE